MSHTQEMCYHRRKRTFQTLCRALFGVLTFVSIGASYVVVWAQSPSDTIAARMELMTRPCCKGMHTGARAGEEWDENKLKMKFCWCPAGFFTMGSPESEEGRDSDESDENQVKVELAQGFWLGKVEVTQGQWTKVKGTEPWKGRSYIKTGAECAASMVSWNEAAHFCRKLTEMERNAGRLVGDWSYSLPTEAQWEYACRADTSTRFNFGNDESKLGVYTWYYENSWRVDEWSPLGVGLKKSNGWGLQDMHGNASEWCRDWYTEKLAGGRNPEVTTMALQRVIRGGSVFSTEAECRCAARDKCHPDFQTNHLGFRVALVRAPEPAHP